MGLMGKLALALVALGGAAFFFTGNSPREPDPCQDALDQAASLLASGNAAAARSQTVLATASCSGEARAKATDLQAAADKVLARQAACERSFRQIGNLVADRRLEKARSQLDALETACVESPQGKALQQKINQARATATDAAGQVRQHLAEGNLKSAREQLERLAASNREHADLAGLRQEVQAAGARQEREAMPEQTPAPPLRAAQPAPSPAPAAPAPQPVANAQAEMAQVLLRDAENALRQLRFDAAKTFVDSAQRLDPQNPQAAALARRIKERELQYLREETSIK
ncbi:hypothetical protein [Rubrivivax gelatinosus]|uniref:DUF4398 domain-containing protein n=1 Tax=Rubrivivax gelatinosus TaxID=28068 RepID=A0A4R2MK33_RUBGE|nr:hypothetical protein [Rubrivivax gelatinosus]MBK1689377.1 hypothetical protein [Rubrivivax gelatinosus]TCP05357.1 hypothetical protein EV684_101229 [Rubrivivax gelatinosus]